MRILQIVPSLNSGGVETGTIDLACALKKDNNEVFVVSSGGSKVELLSKAEVKHITLSVKSKTPFLFFQIPKLMRIIKDYDIEIVHASSRVPAWIGYFACKMLGIPFVTSCHGYYSRHLFSKIMAKASLVMVISKSIEQRMIQAFGVSRDKIRLVYRGVDLDKYTFDKSKYNKIGDVFKIVNIARITPLKGHVEFIKAMKYVCDKEYNIQAWIVGSSDLKKKDYLAYLKNLVKKLGLQEKIEFFGSQNDVRDFLKQSDLLVLSSNRPEAFGRVVIEAGAMGTCVCASNIGGIPEIIKHGESGLLFNPGDPASMGESVIAMIKDEALRKKCSFNLRKTVEENFTLKKMAEKTLDVYREATEIKNILVIKPGSLGDLILVVPSLRSLRKSFSKSKISLLTQRMHSSFMKDCPYADEIIDYDGKNLFISLIKDLKNKNFDFCIDFKNSNKTHMLAFLSRIDRRLGYKRGSMGFLLNWSVGLPDRDLPPVEHQFQVLRRLGIKEDDQHLELWINKDAQESVDSLLQENSISSKDITIGLVVGASLRWVNKQWSKDLLEELMRRLICNENLKVVLLGASYNTVAFNKDLLKNRNIINLVGKTTIKELVALIKRMNCLFTPDSAALHIASALCTKSVVVFGPTSSKRHAPPGGYATILEKELPCRPCYSTICRNKHEKNACLNSITTKEAYDAIMHQLGRI